MIGPLDRLCGISTQHERIWHLGRSTDPYALLLQVFVDGFLAALAANAAPLVATERRHETDGSIRVDPHRARAQLLRHSSARRILCVHTPAARPYTVSLAIAIASSSSSNGMTDRTGPKISSCAIRIWLLTPVKIVGSTNQPSPKRLLSAGPPP